MRVERRAPPALPLPTMDERAAAARAARQLRAAWPALGPELEQATAHILMSRPRRSVWITTWAALPGFKRVNQRYEHELLPGWEYTREEVAEEMIPDLERLAERGERPTEATR